MLKNTIKLTFNLLHKFTFFSEIIYQYDGKHYKAIQRRWSSSWENRLGMADFEWASLGILANCDQSIHT